jgi:hypothetical protein
MEDYIMEPQTLLLVHTGLSFLALAFGAVAIGAYFQQTPRIWTRVFLLVQALVLGTGFLFPLPGVTPAVAVGVIGTLVLIGMALAVYAFRLQGIWARLFALGVVVSTFFQAFVTVAQAFTKLPELKALAPTGTEFAFAISELAVLLIFVLIGWRVWRRVGSTIPQTPDHLLSAAG